MIKNQLLIKKASGKEEPFSEEKYRASLRRAGVDENTISEIVAEVLPTLNDGVSTHALYATTYRLLKKRKHGFAGRYHLKGALMKLGPTGYPFERFVARLFENKGYTTQVSMILAGSCVTHEVDVVIEKEGQASMIECKFHNKPGIYCPVQTSLYLKARFDDIQTRAGKPGGFKKVFHSCFLVTNTKFSDDARMYGECANLQLLAWGYPQGGGIETLIENFKLHPITCLTQLSFYEIKMLLEEGIVTCGDVIKNVDRLASLHFSSKKIDSIVGEARNICLLGDDEKDGKN